MSDPRPLVIRNGLVVDGTGAPAVHADVAIRDGVITEVGPGLDTTGADVIDADGLVVTPGFVDIHTHFDGQATWDPMLAPSSLHGVTSVAMGNCGVGFAPAKPTPEQHDWLIGMLEGVEDIPGTALAEGLPWDWESFPEYLDALDRRQYAVDIGTHVVHAPLRAYVMGERGADPNEAPTADELLAMADAVRDGVRAGALGFTTSRTVAHRTRDGAPLGTRYSTGDELTALVGAMAETGTGVVQMISDAYLSEDDDVRPRRDGADAHARRALRPAAVDDHPAGRRRCRTAGGRWSAGSPRASPTACTMRNQVAPRPVGVLQGLTASVNPIALCPSFREIADRCRWPSRWPRCATRSAGPASSPSTRSSPGASRAWATRSSPASTSSSRCTSRSTTSRRPRSSVAARAAARGVSPVEETIDLLLGDDGNQLLILTLFNYVHGNLDDVREMLLSPNSVIGLGDAGAHCGAISDASFPTTALALWTHAHGRVGPAAARADGPPPDPAHRAPGRLARPWRAGPRAPRRRQRHRRRPPRCPPPADRPRPARPAAAA